LLLVLRDEEHALPFRNHVDRLFERNLVISFPFLAAGEIEPFHVQQEESPTGLPDPASRCSTSVFFVRRRFEDEVLERAYR